MYTCTHVQEVYNCIHVHQSQARTGEIIGERGDSVYMYIKCTPHVQEVYNCKHVHQSQARMGEIIGEKGTVYTCTSSVHLHPSPLTPHSGCAPHPLRPNGDPNSRDFGTAE